MGDDTLLPSDEDGEEGSDDDEHSEGEGQGDQDDDDADSTTEANPPELARIETNGSADLADDNGTVQDRERDASSSPDLPLATLSSVVGHEHGTAGSPLRNVVTFPQMLEERSPDLNSDGEAEAEGEVDEVSHDNIHESIQREMDNSDMQGTYHMSQDGGMGLQSDSAVQYDTHFSDGKDGDVMSMDHGNEYMDDEDMLLDGDVSGIDFGTLSGEHGQYPDPFPDDDDEEEIMPVPVQEHIPAAESQHMDQAPLSSMQETIAVQQVSEGGREEEEDTFEDLLGSLEDHLNEQGPGPDAETEGLDDTGKGEDEVDHVPVPDDFAATSTAPGLMESVTVNPIQDGAAIEIEEMESRDIETDVKAMQGEEGGESIAASTGHE
jgi:hypothetical protein